MSIIRLLDCAQGPTPYDGQFVAEYDPNRRGLSPDGEPMDAVLRTTPDPVYAEVFADFAAAWACWTQTSTRWPVRADGKPNRPLTAFTIEVLPSPVA